MQVKTIAYLLATASLAVLACAQPADQDGEAAHDTAAQADQADARAALEQLAPSFDAAMAAGDLDALMATYASDPVALPPGGEAARGRQAVRQLWQGFMAQGETRTENRVVESWVSGDLGGAWGTYTLTITPQEGEPIEDAGKFMFIARRQADGSWKSAVNIWNSNSEQMPMGN